jgi:hypothetical protein
VAQALKRKRKQIDERDLVEKVCANDPLWAAQTIVDHAPRDLIERFVKEAQR